MQPAPIPKNETERLISLHKLGLLDTKPEERFDRITKTATKIFGVPISTLTLVDEKREWFKSVCGLDQKEGDRAISFCGHALLANKVFIIPDTKKDVRFSDNPMVIDKPYIRFYAGVPIMNADGKRIGVFCIKDTKPRKFSKSDTEVLKNIAAWAEIEINSRNLSLAISEERKARAKSETQTKQLVDAKVAAHNVLEDLNTEKSKVEMAKAKEEAILMSIGDGLLSTDRDGNITLVNKSFEKMLSWSAKEVQGKPIYLTVPMLDDHGNTMPQKNRLITKILHGKSTTTTTTTSTDFYYQRKDGSSFPVDIIISPIIVEGEVTGAVEVFRDITKEKEIDKAKSEFISLASHQLKTPSTAIKLITERILKERVGKLTEKQREYFDDICSASQRMIELVNALLDVSRIELGAFNVTLFKKDVCVVLQNILYELKPNFDKKQLVLQETHQEKSTVLLIDESMLRMVINNLVTNAINYTPAGGTIKIDCREINKDQMFGGNRLQENCFTITITDTGYGIPKHQQSKLFTKFFRADNAREKRPDGTGLGLYVVKSILDNSGGSIRFASPAVVETMADKEENKPARIATQSVAGGGTTFYVTIPMTGMRSKK